MKEYTVKNTRTFWRYWMRSHNPKLAKFTDVGQIAVSSNFYSRIIVKLDSTRNKKSGRTKKKRSD